MKTSQIFGCIGGVAALWAIAATVQAQETVLIGSAGALTGNLAALGQGSDNGVKLAVEEINARGLTIAGKPVTLKVVSKDDGADPRTATVVAQALVDEGIVAIAGHLNSGATIPASKIYSDAGITQIASSSNPTYTLQGFKTTFRVVATDAQQAPALAKYVAASMGAKKVAIVDDATTYGQGLADQFEKTIKAMGVTVTSRNATSDKAVDFRAILTKIKGENPDVIMFGGVYSGAGPFAKQAKQLGVRAKIVGGDGICTTALAELADNAVDSIVCSEVGVPLNKMPGAQAFEAKYVKRFNQSVQSYSPHSYDAVYVIVEAMKRANSTDKAKILAAMPATKYDGVTGPISFDKNGDLSKATISIFKYVGGKKEFVAESALTSAAN